jgi:hypothetical protein
MIVGWIDYRLIVINMEIRMEINLLSYALPDKYIRNGQDCFLCHCRKKLIKVSPEEKVRQKLVGFLQEEKAVPLEAIEVEVPLSRFKKGARDRADIVVYYENRVVLLIECKEPEVALTFQVFDQVYRYNNHIKSKVVAVTNGKKLVVRGLDENERQYKDLASLPEYKQLVEGGGFIFKETSPRVWARVPHSSLFDSQTIQHFKRKKLDSSRAYIYFNTDDSLCPAIISLIDLFMDDSRRIQGELPLKTVKFVKDEGIRFARYGNASGYNFDEYYRYFMVEDRNGNHHIISFAIYEQSSPVSGRTSLMVAIDDNDQGHHALEMNLDKCLTLHGNKFHLRHNGVMTLNKGHTKTQELLDFVKIKAPELMEGQKIYLGSFDLSIELNWDLPEVKSFISRLIDYAFLRHEFRAKKMAGLI